MNEVTNEIEAIRSRMEADAQRLAELQRSLPPEAVADCDLMTRDGPVKLSQFFQDVRDLIVIHNMGKSCRYCTLWADGFNGLADHLHDRCAVVLVSPDDAETLEAFADDRGWLFAVASAKDSSFIQDMGFEHDGKPSPGVSMMYLDEDGSIVRVARDGFGPFDPYCSAWHLFARLKDGVNDWEPKLDYEGVSVCEEGCGCH